MFEIAHKSSGLIHMVLDLKDGPELDSARSLSCYNSKAHIKALKMNKVDDTIEAELTVASNYYL